LTYSKRLLYSVLMNCSRCNVECQRFGKHRNGLQRFRCPQCGKTYTEEQRRLFTPMIPSEEKASREPTNRHAHCKVLAFDVAGGNVPHVGTPITYFYYRLHHRGGRIAASSVVLAMIAVELYHLREVRLSRENILNRPHGYVL